MKILITGAAGFIGSFLAEALLKRGEEVVGIDNLNDYYDFNLKYSRLKRLGIQLDVRAVGAVSSLYPRFRFQKADITDLSFIKDLFEKERFDMVCNLAAQAGVRYSIENPYAYVQSNVVGFLNILEGCRHTSVRHLVFASSSSVYGLADHYPFQESDKTDAPVSLYGATKKADELMAHAYSKLYHLPTTGLRYFTVYGPWGRPDMAPFLFLDKIVHDGTIQVFNNGQMQRDFTYVDDVVEATVRVLNNPPSEEIPYRIYNVGHSSPLDLMDFIHLLEKCAGKTVKKEYKGMQQGDVLATYADTHLLENDIHFKPSTSIEEGVQAFYNWYMGFRKN